MSRCAFLMSSCDAYEDLWEPFFECLHTFWENIQYPIYLNTEHKKFKPQKEMKFSVTTLNQYGKKSISWSKRFIEALERVPEEYIFLLLDDYFVCREVESPKFEEILDLLDKDKTIASVQMCGTRVRNRNSEKYDCSNQIQYRQMGREGWKTHFVPTIWRKSVLLKWLRPWESIWAFEECGSKRARRWNYPEKVYVIDNPPIYDYLWIRDCSAVINGKWLAEEELLDFFDDNQISVDWSKRGKMTWDEYQAITMQDVIKKYSIGQIIMKSINRVRSFF